MKLTLLALCGLLLAAATAFADPRSQFEEGLTHYRSDDWEQAVMIWEQLRDQGYASGALEYNLGNAYYRLNELSKSILAYERARRLLPRDRDTRSNLEFARLSVVDRIEPPLRLALWSSIDRLRDSLTLRELAGLMEIIGLLLAAGVVAHFLLSMRIRGLLRPLLIVLAVLYITSVSWYAWRSSLDAREFAIIMTEKVDVYSGPDDTTTQLFTLHEGTRIEARERLSGWLRIRLADGREGWLQQQEIETI